MANGNGTNGAIKIIGFVVTILGSAILIYSTFHAPLAKAIAAEAEARTMSDMAIIKEQQPVNQQILITLAEIKTDLNYIKAKVR
jgi:hypothetical protein